MDISSHAVESSVSKIPWSTDQQNQSWHAGCIKKREPRILHSQSMRFAMQIAVAFRHRNASRFIQRYITENLPPLFGRLHRQPHRTDVCLTLNKNNQTTVDIQVHAGELYNTHISATAGHSIEALNQALTQLRKRLSRMHDLQIHPRKTMANPFLLAQSQSNAWQILQEKTDPFNLESIDASEIIQFEARRKKLHRQGATSKPLLRQPIQTQRPLLNIAHSVKSTIVGATKTVTSRLRLQPAKVSLEKDSHPQGKPRAESIETPKRVAGATSNLEKKSSLDSSRGQSKIQTDRNATRDSMLSGLQLDNLRSAYNYEHFNIATFERELANQHRMSRPGDRVPDITLLDLSGQKVSLKDYLGKEVVLETGSISCPLFIHNMREMQDLAQLYPEKVFLVLYVRETFPGGRIHSHHYLADKLEQARRLQNSESESRRILLDTIDGKMHRFLGYLPNMLVHIDKNGLIKYKTNWNRPLHLQMILNGLLVHWKNQPVRPPHPPFALARRVLLRAGVRACWDFIRELPKLPNYLNHLQEKSEFSETLSSRVSTWHTP